MSRRKFSRKSSRTLPDLTTLDQRVLDAARLECEILETLAQESPLTLTAIAERVKKSAPYVRLVLTRLAADRLVKVSGFAITLAPVEDSLEDGDRRDCEQLTLFQEVK